MSQISTGKKENKFGIGATVDLYSGKETQTIEVQTVRGFQSSVSPRQHFGLGASEKIDSLVVRWPDGSTQKLHDLASNQLLVLNQEDSNPTNQTQRITSQLLTPIPSVPDYTPNPNTFNDFKRQPLMLTMASSIDPVLSQGDLNGDGIPELFVGGSKGKAGEIFSKLNGQWQKFSGYTPDNGHTDAVAIFKDFNGDEFQDLFVGSGGYHDYIGSDEALLDRLYLNDGSGKLILQTNFPDYKFSTGTAQAIDINGDGAMDLFVGAKLIPGRYPIIQESKILINDGEGNFIEDSRFTLPNNGEIGMVTSSEKMDLDGDGNVDLILSGEFMPLTALVNNGAGFEDQTPKYFSANLSGWWGSLVKADIDNDGDLDLIAGNFGLNSQFEASENKLLRLYADDFDQNGSVDPILECFVEDKMYPFPSRDELLMQMVGMRSRFTDYASYSKATMEDLFTRQELEKAQILEANTLESYYLENRDGQFIAKPLPKIAQSFPVYSILPIDLNSDGNLDLILGGNQSAIRIRIGNIDAGMGLVLLGDGKGNFESVSPSKSGLSIKGDIKSIVPITYEGKTDILFGINQKPLKIFEVK